MQDVGPDSFFHNTTWSKQASAPRHMPASEYSQLSTAIGSGVEQSQGVPAVPTRTILSCTTTLLLQVPGSFVLTDTANVEQTLSCKQLTHCLLMVLV